MRVVSLRLHARHSRTSFECFPITAPARRPLSPILSSAALLCRCRASNHRARARRDRHSLSSRTTAAYLVLLCAIAVATASELKYAVRGTLYSGPSSTSGLFQSQVSPFKADSPNDNRFRAVLGAFAIARQLLQRSFGPGLSTYGSKFTTVWRLGPVGPREQNLLTLNLLQFKAADSGRQP